MGAISETLNEDQSMMLKAWMSAFRSKCKKRQVGGVFVLNKRAIIDGYNGTISGANNNCETECISCSFCSKDMVLSEFITTDESIIGTCTCGNKHEFSHEYVYEHSYLITNYDVIHAEENIILYAAKHGIALDGGKLYITKAPCIKCARMIAGVNIVEVIYSQSSNSGNEDGIDYLKRKEIKVRQYILDLEVFKALDNLKTIITEEMSLGT